MTIEKAVMNQTTIRLAVDLSQVFQLRPDDKPMVVMGDMHDSVEVYVVLRDTRPEGDVVTRVLTFVANGDKLILNVENAR